MPALRPDIESTRLELVVTQITGVQNDLIATAAPGRGYRGPRPEPAPGEPL